MKKRLLARFGLTATAVVVCAAMSGCGSRSGATAENEMAKSNFEAERNTVSVVKLERRTFCRQLISNGRLEAQNKAVLRFATQGTIARLSCAEGQWVAKGAVLATLDKRQAESQLKSAQLAFDKAEMALADRLLDYGYTIADTASIPAQQKRAIYINTGYTDARLSLENARYQYSNCELRAPFAGKLASISGSEHEQTESQFATLIDDSRFFVKFSILETEYSFVRPHQKITVIPFANQQISIEGEVVTVNPTVDKNGQIAVTAAVPGHQALIDGMNVKVIVEDQIEDQLVVPKSAVVIRDGMEVLFRYAEGRSVWTYVNVMMSNTTEHVVKSNTDRGSELNVGDMIITSGNLNLGDNVEVEVENGI